MKKFALCLIALTLSACVGSSPVSQFYTLRSADTQTASIVSDKVSFYIGVDRVKVPYYMDRPQMVTMKQNEIEVSISEQNRWAEPLALILQRKITDDISSSLPKAKVRAQSYSLENFDYTVSVEIIKLNPIIDDKVVLEAVWQISNPEGKTVAQHKFQLEKPVGKTYEDIVSVESKMIEELSVQIAQALSKLKK